MNICAVFEKHKVTVRDGKDHFPRFYIPFPSFVLGELSSPDFRCNDIFFEINNFELHDDWFIKSKDETSFFLLKLKLLKQ